MILWMVEGSLFLSYMRIPKVYAGFTWGDNVREFYLIGKFDWYELELPYVVLLDAAPWHKLRNGTEWSEV